MIPFKPFKVSTLSLLLLAALLSLWHQTPCGVDAQEVYDVIRQSDDHEMLFDLIDSLASMYSITSGSFGGTFFAPTDEALAFALPDRFLEPQYWRHLSVIMEHHLTIPMLMSTDLVLNQQLFMFSHDQATVTRVETNNIMIDDATITDADIVATNGIVHVVDKVLLPDFVNTDVVDAVLAEDRFGGFSILASLLEKAQLVETLKTPGPFTLIAPSDDAFAQLSNKVNEYLSSPEGLNDLQSILSYHVVPGVNLLPSPNFIGSPPWREREWESATGEGILLSNDKPSMNNQIIINVGEARVIGINVLANNGVIHVIDSVLIPPDIPLIESVADFTNREDFPDATADDADVGEDVADTPTDSAAEDLEDGASVPEDGAPAVPAPGDVTP